MGVVNLGPIYYGDTHIAEFVFEEPDLTRLNLTGCTLEWAISRRVTGNYAIRVATHTLDTIMRVIDAENGIAAAFMDPEALGIGTYQHCLEATLPSGEVYTYATGRIKVVPCLNEIGTSLANGTLIVDPASVPTLYFVGDSVNQLWGYAVAGSYLWRSIGNVPPGLTFGTGTPGVGNAGRLYGTPTTPGAWTFTIILDDATVGGNGLDSRTYTVTIL